MKGVGVVEVEDVPQPEVPAGGALLRMVPVGVQPLAVAVDARTGQAFVVNYGGTVRQPPPWAGPWVPRLRQWLPRTGWC